MSPNFRCGFETIGNATVICYDENRPVLSTDPWIQGAAYFGSWGMSHEIPKDQFEAAKNSEFVWFSHGHPDHLNGESLDLFKGRKILLPDHFGGRIRKDLTEMGFDVTVLPHRKWITLSDHIRVLCVCDSNQDGILLIDINGRLVINLNDASDRGWGRFVKKIAQEFSVSFLLALTGYGDADMKNFYDEQGNFIEPPAMKKFPVGAVASRLTESLGARYFVPFSSMHCYQRADSIWANTIVTPVEAHGEGFDSKNCDILPPFISYNCETDSFDEIRPTRSERKVYDPEIFGDSWEETLEADDKRIIEEYFKSFKHLESFIDFVNICVGGEETNISLRKRKFNRGITFEVPRHSLMQAVEYEVFDDLLIANFMKTTLHGNWKFSGLYPDFTPYVTKYGDNGQAKTPEQLAAYFEYYKKIAPVEAIQSYLESRAINFCRSFVPHDQPAYHKLKQFYYKFKQLSP